MRKRIGDYLMDKGILTKDQVKEILKYSKSVGLRFGEAGMELGVIKKDDLLKLFGPSFGVDYFHLEPEYFPAETKEIFPIPYMIKHGVVPLGFKTEYKFFRPKKQLNLGFLSPSDRSHVREVEGYAMSHLNDPSVIGVKNFLILAEQFLNVLSKVYGVQDDQIHKMDPKDVAENLSLFLESSTDSAV